ncbi:MAG TPA: adenylate/guanylate cyclase domain-containing protein [Actinomycetota bacterium]|nr:adenylate/guanylate cyclase domain-containing protein [Actinomycetota bacterium]
MAGRVEMLAFLFTDIEGSTNLLRDLGVRYRAMLLDHRRLLKATFERYGGRLLGSEGDSLFTVFPTPEDALLAAAEGQFVLGETKWPDGIALKVRMGIHIGDVVVEEDEYIGLAVHQASRISNAAHGNQILLSEATQRAAAGALPADITLEPVGQFRLKDFPEPQALFQLHHPRLPSDFPAPRTAGGRTHNLPRMFTSFIGRDHELKGVIELLRANRLITLTGPGGCGKTRLAIEAASASLALRPDGIWFVDLAPVSDPDLVLATAAEAMNLTETGRDDLDGATIGFLSRGSPLVILDNCEHLIDACSALVERWLASCPSVTILVTAREPIGIAGEVIRRVPGLDVGSDGGGGPSEAAQLFVDRASAHDPGFEPAEDELDLIAQLTRRLDGIPLAIEMAAGLIGALDVREIVSRLDDRFRLLTGGSGRTLGRQQTLLATVEWSHDLLRPAEQMLLRRLATMSGSFSLDAVDAICSGDGLDRAEMVPLLRRLVATSWLLKERGGTHTRYRMLETSRQYALERLIAASEAERFRGRHDAWFLELAEDAAGFLLGGPEQANWFDRVELELDNLRTALAWSLGEGDATVALRICTALARFWEVRGHWTEALRWFDQALERASGAPDHLRAPALVSASFMAFYRGSLDEARDLAEQGLATARGAGDRVSEARGMRFLAVTEQRSGNEDTALDLAERAVALSRTAGVGADLAFALQVLGRLTSDPDEAGIIFNEGLSVARAAKDGVSQIYLLYALGQLALRKQEEAEAREHFNEALEIAHRLRERWMAMNVLVGLSRVSEEIDAGPAVEEMIGLLRQIGNRLMLVRWLRQLAYLRRAEGDAVGARRAVDEALSVIQQDGTDEAEVLGHFILAGQLAEGEGDHRSALRESQAGVRLAHHLGSTWETTFGLGEIGRELALVGDHARAATVLGAAEASQERVGMRPAPRRALILRQTTEEVAEVLGHAEFERLWSLGREMPLDDIVTLATETSA